MTDGDDDWARGLARDASHHENIPVEKHSSVARRPKESTKVVGQRNVSKTNQQKISNQVSKTMRPLLWKTSQGNLEEQKQDDAVYKESSF